MNVPFWKKKWERKRRVERNQRRAKIYIGVMKERGWWRKQVGQSVKRRSITCYQRVGNGECWRTSGLSTGENVGASQRKLKGEELSKEALLLGGGRKRHERQRKERKLVARQEQGKGVENFWTPSLGAN